MGFSFPVPEADHRQNGERISLFLNAVCEFFDNRVGEDFFGDALDIGLGLVGSEAVGEGKGEILALTDCVDAAKADLAEGVLDGLTLGVEDR
jgi:hypothetical protein